MNTITFVTEQGKVAVDESDVMNATCGGTVSEPIVSITADHEAKIVDKCGIINTPFIGEDKKCG